MPETPTEEEQARAELARIAKAVGRLRRRLKALQGRFPETPEDHPLLPNTIWSVCEEVDSLYLGLAETRLTLMASLTEEDLKRRKAVYRTTISVLLAALSHLPEEYVAVAAVRLMDMPLSEFWKAMLALRSDAEERFLEQLIRERGIEGLRP